MSDTVTIALVGIAGYGSNFVESVLDRSEGLDIKCVAAIEPNPDRCNRLDELKAAGARVFFNMDEFCAKSTADLVVISSPIHRHCGQTCLALENGSNVLCEKPVSGTIQGARKMSAAEDKSGKFVAIGYQWSFSTAIQTLKQDVMGGVLGAPKRFKTMVLWPRNEVYYNRNDWAAKRKAPGGEWILDSPINNAMAHYLHNMFYVLGSTRETSAIPIDVVAELYRANDIENFDTGALCCHTDNGVEILFLSTHAVSRMIGPIAHYEFENADVHFGLCVDGETQFIAKFRDGTVKEYGSPNADAFKKFPDSVESVRTGDPVACGVRAASAHILCVSGMHDSAPDIIDFPRELIKVDGEPGSRQTWVEGLQEIFTECYDRGILPSEHDGIKWTKRGKKVDLTNYGDFPGGGTVSAG